MIAGDQFALPATIVVGDDRLAVWPEQQKVAPLAAPLSAITTFADHVGYHDALVGAVLRAERDPRFRMGDLSRRLRRQSARDRAVGPSGG